MKLAVGPTGIWVPACRARLVDHVAIPIPTYPGANPYAADVQARMATGAEVMRTLEGEGVDLIVDSCACGLSFVEGPAGLTELELGHEALNVPLISHFTEPIYMMATGMSWEVIWDCIASTKWVKAVSDLSHAEELCRFGFGDIVHLPPAAMEFAYDSRPLNDQEYVADVAFVGDSARALYGDLVEGPPEKPWPIGVAEAIGQSGSKSFYELYHEVGRIAVPPSTIDSTETRQQKATAYFRAKLRFTAHRCLAHRDRQVKALRQKLGDRFRLVGKGWESADGHEPASAPTSIEAYINQFRTAAINVVIPDRGADSGLCSHHFEVTAAGGFLLCCENREVAACLEVGRECDTFANETELFEKIEYYLAHSERRREIAAAGQQRAQREHLYRHRLDAVMKVGEEIKRQIDAAGKLIVPEPPKLPDFAGGPLPTIRVNESPGRLLIILNPGRFTRHYLVDMTSAARRLGVEVVNYEISDTWTRLGAGVRDDPDFDSWLQRERVQAVISCAPNGISEWPHDRGAAGSIRPFFEAKGIPHLMWWTDHPQWNSEKVGLRADLQPLLCSPNTHHFVKSEAAAAEMRDMLGWPCVYGLPVAEDPTQLIPVAGVEPEFDVVTVIGSVPHRFEKLDAFLDDDDPDLAAMNQIIAADVRDDLQRLWVEHAPATLQGALTTFGERWTEARRIDPLTASHGLFTTLESEHVQAVAWLRENPSVYFNAVEALWAFGQWQRAFFLMYLARRFSVGVMGSDWSSVGLGSGSWVDHVGQPAAYAQGKIAINISQAGDEEGIAHKPFQIAASGVPMLHINRKGLEDCFTPNKEVAVFDTPREACDQIRALLDDPDRRRRMAEAARARLCRDHTWEKRLAEMLTLAGVHFPMVSQEAKQARSDGLILPKAPQVDQPIQVPTPVVSP